MGIVTTDKGKQVVVIRSIGMVNVGGTKACFLLFFLLFFEQIILQHILVIDTKKAEEKEIHSPQTNRSN